MPILTLVVRRTDTDCGISPSCMAHTPDEACTLRVRVLIISLALNEGE